MKKKKNSIQSNSSISYIAYHFQSYATRLTKEPKTVDIDNMV